MPSRQTYTGITRYEIRYFTNLQCHGWWFHHRWLASPSLYRCLQFLSWVDRLPSFSYLPAHGRLHTWGHATSFCSHPDTFPTALTFATTLLSREQTVWHKKYSTVEPCSFTVNVLLLILVIISRCFSCCFDDIQQLLVKLTAPNKLQDVVDPSSWMTSQYLSNRINFRHNCCQENKLYDIRNTLLLNHAVLLWTFCYLYWSS